jgi:hypothetical protein
MAQPKGELMETRSKYNARRVTVDGQRFASQVEAREYGNLKIRQAAGEITGLRLQPRYTLQDGFVDQQGRRWQPVTYVADFAYVETATGRHVAEDVKGMKTAVFAIKEKWFRWAYLGVVDLVVVPASEV